MSQILIKNSRLVDHNRESHADILIADGVVTQIADSIQIAADSVIDAGGLVLMPSFIDLHSHFRDPGQTQKEDIETGCLAAVHGGYTAVNLMPNTKPVCSSMQTVDYVLNKAKALNLCDVYQTVSITNGFDGHTLSHIDEIANVKWLTDDGYGVDNTDVMLKAMRKAHEKGMGVMLHEEDSALAKIDSMFSEELPTFRDVRLAELTGCKTHFCHVSTQNAMQYIIEGKRRGAPITCEVSPHHLALNINNGGKVNPPLRPEEHRLAMIEAVRNGYADAIATDHAPHTTEDKQNGMNGFTGLDLSFAVCYTTLVKEGVIDLPKLSRLLSYNPAQIMQIDCAAFSVGSPANFVLLELDTPFIAGEKHIHSKSKNSPFIGMNLWGTIMMTMNRGDIVYRKKD